jgi:hypothetical protein
LAFEDEEANGFVWGCYDSNKLPPITAVTEQIGFPVVMALHVQPAKMAPLFVHVHPISCRLCEWGAELPATSSRQPRLLGEVGKRLRSLLAVELVEQRLRKWIVDLTPEPLQLIVPDAPSCRDRSSNVPALSLSHRNYRLQD